MTIERVQAFAVRYPEPNNDGKIRSLTLVRIETRDGVVGWGEAITGAQEVSLATAFLVERRLAPIVIGRDPRDVKGAWAAMRDATYWDGNGGILTFGISAIDMALWDIAGHIAGLPVHRLLRGRQPGADRRLARRRSWPWATRTASPTSSGASWSRDTDTSRVAGDMTCPSRSDATRRAT